VSNSPLKGEWVGLRSRAGDEKIPEKKQQNNAETAAKKDTEGISTVLNTHRFEHFINLFGFYITFFP
jgi:hypothetical protein